LAQKCKIIFVTNKTLRTLISTSNYQVLMKLSCLVPLVRSALVFHSELNREW